MRRTLLISLALLAAPGLADGQTPQPSVDGTWATLIVTTSISRLPVIGDLKTVSRFYSINELEREGDELRMTTTPCWVRLEGGIARFKTIVPEKMTKVLGPRRRTGSIDGREIVFPRAVDVLGARLADEWRDALPTNSSDVRVIDEDGDGHPGVTIKIFGPIDGSIYLTQRSWNALRGRLDADGSTIRGEVGWAQEQRILGATSPFLRSNPQPRPDADPSASFFEMRRVPAAMTCDDLRRSHQTLLEQ